MSQPMGSTANTTAESQISHVYEYFIKQGLSHITLYYGYYSPTVMVYTITTSISTIICTIE